MIKKVISWPSHRRKIDPIMTLLFNQDQPDLYLKVIKPWKYVSFEDLVAITKTMTIFHCKFLPKLDSTETLKFVQGQPDLGHV